MCGFAWIPVFALLVLLCRTTPAVPVYCNLTFQVSRPVQGTPLCLVLLYCNLTFQVSRPVQGTPLCLVLLYCNLLYQLYP